MRIKKVSICIFIMLLTITILPCYANENTKNTSMNNEINESKNNLIFMDQTRNDASYDMVIITPEKFSNSLQKLINHKQLYGIATYTKTTEDIYQNYPGRDNPEKIKYFIKDALETKNIQYVLLIGNKETLPVRYATIYFDEDLTNNNHYHFPFFQSASSENHLEFISDLYYADIYDQYHDFSTWDSNNNNVFAEANSMKLIDTVDLYPDVAVGRLLCDTTDELDTIINKIIKYETNTYDSSWFKNLILLGGDTHTNIDLEKNIISLAPVDAEIAWEGEYMCELVAETLPLFQAKKYYASGILRTDVQRLSTNNINQAMNQGAGFIFFGLHGNVDLVATHFPYLQRSIIPFPKGYQTNEINLLSNAEKLSVAVLPACYCGDFNTVDSPFAWKLISHPMGGAIISYAITTEGLYWPSTLAAQSLSGYTAMIVFKAYADGIDISGDIWDETITRYLNDDEAIAIGNMNYQAPMYYNNFALESWILFGDPSLKIGGYPPN